MRLIRLRVKLAQYLLWMAFKLLGKSKLVFFKLASQFGSFPTAEQQHKTLQEHYSQKVPDTGEEDVIDLYHNDSETAYAKIMAWCKVNKWEHVGKWVAFIDGNFVGADSNYALLSAETRKKHGRAPTMIKITPLNFPGMPLHVKSN